MGPPLYGDICASGADHRSVLTFMGQIFAVKSAVWGFHQKDVHPSGSVLSGIEYLLSLNYCGYGRAAMFVIRYSRRFSVVAGWFGGDLRAWNAIVSVFGGLAAGSEVFERGWYFW